MDLSIGHTYLAIASAYLHNGSTNGQMVVANAQRACGSAEFFVQAGARAIAHLKNGQSPVTGQNAFHG